MNSSLIKLTALFLPGIFFMLLHNYKAAIICLVLQISIIGWIPASVWAVLNMDDYIAKKKVKNYLKSIREYNG